jgi:hypothetical protein
MYVAPTPFALTEGTTGLMTLIVPERLATPPDTFQQVGRLARVEAAELVIGYTRPGFIRDEAESVDT